MPLDVRTALCLNTMRVQRQIECIFIKEDRRDRLLRWSKAEIIPSDARIVACEYK